ncbi:PhlD [Kitasatospora albolonga]
MDVVIGRPVVRAAPYRVGTDELMADMRARYAGHPRIEVWLRMLRHTGVEDRPWISPVDGTAARRGVRERSRAAYEGARELAVGVAADALEQAGLGAGDIDLLVTTHTTSWTVPGLDVDLVGLLGLRPDVARVGLATAACSGGGHALVHAARFLRGRSDGGRALVVAAEQLSTLYNPSAGPPDMQAVLYGGLFGDSAAAVVVSADPGATGGGEAGAGGGVAGAGAVTGEGVGVGVATGAGGARAGFVVDDVWEFVLPDSSGAYWGVIDENGLAFDSGPDAKRAPGRVLPHLTEWLGGRPVGWAAVHPGGPGIIAGTLTGLGLDAEVAGRHARASLSHGNLGGAALLDVLARTLADDPPEGPGVAVAFGPGFTAAGLYLHLRDARGREGLRGAPAPEGLRVTPAPADLRDTQAPAAPDAAG